MPDRIEGTKYTASAEEGKEVETFGHGICKGVECLPAGSKFLQIQPFFPALQIERIYRTIGENNRSPEKVLQVGNVYTSNSF